MAARSSNEIVQKPFNPVLPPVIDLKSQEKLIVKENQTDAGPEAFEFVTEKFVDFESLKVNGIDVQGLFFDQQWKNYFEMRNGFVYYDIVKYLWKKATVFDRFCADEEVRKMVEKDSSLRGKSRRELGLKPYRGKEIRSNILGINVLITQEHIAKVLGLDNKGENVDDYDEKSKHLEAIKQDLFLPGSSNSDFGKAKFMRPNFGFAFRVFLASIITREGGYDTISIPHRHFIWFMYKKVKINLAKILFDHLCLTISKSRTKSTSSIHHPRLISEIIRQTKLVDILSTKEKIRVFNTAKFDATVLVNMKKKTKEEIKQAKTPLQAVYEEYFWCDGFPTISEHDNDAVVKNFLELVRIDTGISVPRSMVIGVPNWDIFKGPKEITRSKRKPKPIEQEIVEEGSQAQPENRNDGADETEQVISGAERLATEGNEQVTEEQLASIAQRKAAQKEKRSKKRLDRSADADAEGDQHVRAVKKAKTVASKKKAASKGTTSMPNTDSIPFAQSPKQSPPIDYTKPLSVVLPSPQPSSSSSSEATLSDSSIDSDELISKLDRIARERAKKKKSIKRTPKKTIPISSDEEEDNTIPEQPSNTSVLDHLTTHLSGDAFTHSNRNSPHQSPPVNTTEPPVQTIQTPPPSHDDIAQENPPTFTPVQDDIMTHSEQPIQSSHSPPIHDNAEQPPQHLPEQIITNEILQSTPEQEHHTTTEQSPSEHQDTQTPPRTTFTLGLIYKPLTVEELIFPVDFALPIQEMLMKEAININDEPIPLSLSPEHSIDLSKIKITPLKRKRPEPTIPFDQTTPFFTSSSEPNIEQLGSAISLRLKKFKAMEEETLIFPSDVDAEIREMEYLFSQTLRTLGDHVKSQIKGKGMTAVSVIMDTAERSHAPRLTLYNHEEEIARLAALDAEIKKLARSACETAEKLLREEAEYERATDQARIEAEIEHKRLADQEALKMLVERAKHIAEVETNKIKENQAAQEDFEMFDQNQLDETSEKDICEDSDKGKKPIIETTSPHSPMKIDMASTSSPIPPAV
ncbi:NADH:ubiquinone reductase (H(+)-translocating) [Trifolium repens]|nr:NADH:ubiquinone reductase (H(+)-translocating) [Trifolium repens]